MYLCLYVLELCDVDILAKRRFFHLFSEGTELSPQGVFQCYSLGE